jgi:molecular chaperone DnaK
MVKQITIENAMARFAVEERDAAQQRLDRMWANPSWNEEEGEETNSMTVGDIIGEEDEADEYFDDEGDEDLPWDDDDEASEPELEPAEQVPQPKPRISAPATPTSLGAPTEGARETVQARSLLEKADRVRGKASAEDQAELDKLTGRVKAALDEKRWADVQSACTELADVLFYLEDA